ncbi:MAG: alpha/beta hydrolase, partial [Bacteroidota bacterium]
WLNKANPYIDFNGVMGSHNYGKGKLVEQLKQFPNKVLIIHGIGDFINLTNPLFNHDLFPNSELKIIQDAGHMMSIDSKAEYFDAINAFLNRE